MGRIEQSKTEEESVTGVIRTVSLVALTALALYLCWLMATPFLSALTWAFALAVVFSPLRTWLSKRMSELVATLLIMVVVMIATGVPGALVLRQLFQESVRAQQLLQRSIQSDDWRSAIAASPWIEELITRADYQLDLREIGQQLAGAMARWIAPAVFHSVSAITQGGVTLLAFFFFLRDEKIALIALRRLLPFSAGEIDQLLSRVASTVQATIYGRILVGSLQGFLGGVIFALVGLPAPVFWGAVMILLSLLPVFGAFLVWVPASLLLIAQGHWIRGLIVVIWALVIIHSVDNLLYPILVSGRIGLHPLVLFIAFVGGLIVFGPAGLVLGPCIIAVAFGLAEIWQSRSARSAAGEMANSLNGRRQ